jgi:hypothetical protein
MTEVQRLYNLLTGLETVKSTEIKTIKIGSYTYDAALYTQELSYTKDMMACTHGDKKPGDKYTRTSYLCLASCLPVEYRKSRKTVYNFNNSPIDWYVSHWSGNPDAKKELRPYAEGFTLGAFGLSPWNVPDGTPIDHYEEKPYTRIPAEVF